MRLSAGQLNRATLARQALLARRKLPVTEAVRSAVALQAQEAASPYVALWNRVEGFDPADLDAAFLDGAVIKATLMRITLHAVHADDYTAFHEAMVPNLRASRLNDNRYRSTGLTVADADRVLPHLVEHVRQARTVPEIEAMLAAHLDDPPEPRLWWALKSFAPIAHAPTGGPWSFGWRPSFRSAPAEPARTDPERALPRLLRRYLEGFGPASTRDFAQFALQRQAEIKPAVEALGDDLVRLEGPNGETLLDVPGGEVPDAGTPAPPRLLGMWDSILLAYADRGRVVPEEYRTVVIRRNGDVLATLLVEGHVAGVWRSRDGRIEAKAFHQLEDQAWDGLESEAAGLLDLIGSREPEVYGRYGHWWESLPATEVRILGR